MAEEQTPESKNETPTEPPAPKVSSEEKLIQSAAEGIDQPGDKPSRVVVPGAKTKFGRKKLILVGVAVLIVAGAGAWFALKKDPAKSGDSTTVTQQQEEEATEKAAALSYIPENVAYAYKAATADPFSVYYRPAIGGERKEAIKLEGDEGVSQTDARGTKVALSTSGGIYTSTDSGKTYKKVVTTKGQEQITGVRIGTSGQKLIYGVTSDSKSNDVKSIDLDGSDSTNITSVDAAGVLIYGWNDTKNQLFYSKGCFNCDGSPSSYRIYNTKTKSDKELTLLEAAKKTNFIQKVAISDDFSIVSVVSGADAASSDNGGFGSGTAPYTVGSYDVGASKLNTVTTIGTKGEKNANGTAKVRTLVTGFLAGTNTQYYTDGTSIFKVEAGKSSSLYKADASILAVDFASDKYIILSTGQSLSDFTLSNYDLTTKKSALIFSGDANTTVVGVTTK